MLALVILGLTGCAHSNLPSEAGSANPLDADTLLQHVQQMAQSGRLTSQPAVEDLFLIRLGRPSRTDADVYDAPIEGWLASTDHGASRLKSSYRLWVSAAAAMGPAKSATPEAELRLSLNRVACLTMNRVARTFRGWSITLVQDGLIGDPVPGQVGGFARHWTTLRAAAHGNQIDVLFPHDAEPCASDIVLRQGRAG